MGGSAGEAGDAFCAVEASLEQEEEEDMLELRKSSKNFFSQIVIFWLNQTIQGSDVFA